MYLLIIALLAIALLFLNLNYASFKNDNSEKTTKLGYTTTVVADAEVVTKVPKWINSLVLVFIALGSTMAIFLFKKRELQKKLCIYIALLGSLLIILMVLDYNTMKAQFPNGESSPGLWSVFPLAFVILGFMAWYKVRKDEELLKSMDRIR